MEWEIPWISLTSKSLITTKQQSHLYVFTYLSLPPPFLQINMPCMFEPFVQNKQMFGGQGECQREC